MLRRPIHKVRRTQRSVTHSGQHKAVCGKSAKRHEQHAEKMWPPPQGGSRHEEANGGGFRRMRREKGIQGKLSSTSPGKRQWATFRGDPYPIEGIF